MKSYILTIDEDLRVQNLIGCLSSANLEPEVVYGVDGRNKSRFFFRGNRHDFLSWLHIGRKLSNEEIACALGHRLIYDLIQKERWGWALVCEDDAIPQIEYSREYIYALIEEIEEIEGVDEKICPKIIHLGPPLLDETDLEEDSSLLRSVRIFNAPIGTYAYLINAEAVNVICTNPKSRDFISPCDWPTQWREKIRFYRSRERLFLTNINSSYILDSRRRTVMTRSIRHRALYRIRNLFLKTSFVNRLLRFTGFID
jgi:GR25 family glycosyltransferase involved in LPS biosynthesis